MHVIKSTFKGGWIRGNEYIRLYKYQFTHCLKYHRTSSYVKYFSPFYFCLLYSEMTPFPDTTLKTGLWVQQFLGNYIGKNVKEDVRRGDVISAPSNRGAALLSLGHAATSVLSSPELALL